MDTPPVIPVEQLTGTAIEEFLSRVFQQGSVTVQFPNGETVLIQPQPKLVPLPVLEGCVPTGWKDAIYHECD
jgi:hypothetical protein